MRFYAMLTCIVLLVTGLLGFFDAIDAALTHQNQLHFTFISEKNSSLNASNSSIPDADIDDENYKLFEMIQTVAKTFLPQEKSHSKENYLTPRNEWIAILTNRIQRIYFKKTRSSLPNHFFEWFVAVSNLGTPPPNFHTFS